MVHWVYHVSWELSQDPPSLSRGLFGCLTWQTLSCRPFCLWEGCSRGQTDPKGSLISISFLLTGVSFRIPAAWAMGLGNGGGKVSTNLL